MTWLTKADVSAVCVPRKRLTLEELGDRDWRRAVGAAHRYRWFAEPAFRDAQRHGDACRVHINSLLDRLEQDRIWLELAAAQGFDAPLTPATTLDRCEADAYIFARYAGRAWMAARTGT